MASGKTWNRRSAVLGGTALAGYNNTRYGGLMTQSDNLRDAGVRLAALAKAEQQLLDDCGVIPFVHDVTRDMVSPQVKGWILNVANFNRSRYLSLDRSIQTS